jgi:uracil-DNA glycosylase family 4
MEMNRSIRQHLDMEDFFAGFTLRTPPDNTPPVESATPEAATGSFETLVQTIRLCTLCELSETRTQTVPGEGHAQADILFVGEAPGADEDAQGRPFVGRAGQLLDKIIEACGLTRDQVFIANILKCRPPGNRDPKADEIAKCMPYLVHQIEFIAPKVIVALGAHAARTLLNTDAAIGKLRGQFHDCHLCPARGPIKLMPTYHPAYLLRNYTPDTRRRVWEDMKKVLVELKLPVP